MLKRTLGEGFAGGEKIVVSVLTPAIGGHVGRVGSGIQMLCYLQQQRAGWSTLPLQRFGNVLVVREFLGIGYFGVDERADARMRELIASRLDVVIRCQIYQQALIDGGSQQSADCRIFAAHDRGEKWSCELLAECCGKREHLACF